MVSCYDVFLEGKFILCNSFEEFHKVCLYLGSKGFKWVKGMSDECELITESSLSIYKGFEYPISVKNFHGEVCWSDMLKVAGETWFRGSKEVKVVQFNELSFD